MSSCSRTTTSTNSATIPGPTTTSRSSSATTGSPPPSGRVSSSMTSITPTSGFPNSPSTSPASASGTPTSTTRAKPPSASTGETVRARNLHPAGQDQDPAGQPRGLQPGLRLRPLSEPRPTATTFDRNGRPIILSNDINQLSGTTLTSNSSDFYRATPRILTTRDEVQDDIAALQVGTCPRTSSSASTPTTNSSTR